MIANSTKKLAAVVAIGTAGDGVRRWRQAALDHLLDVL